VETAVRESEIDEKMRHVVRASAKVHGKVAYVKDLPWSLGKAATYARAYKKTPVGVASEQMNGYVDMSIRSVDLANLQESVSRVAEELGGAGGGHTNSAGARVPSGHFMEFIAGLDRAIQAE
jgi:RecJ-like exonuclease